MSISSYAGYTEHGEDHNKDHFICENASWSRNIVSKKFQKWRCRNHINLKIDAVAV